MAKSVKEYRRLNRSEVGNSRSTITWQGGKRTVSTVTQRVNKRTGELYLHTKEKSFDFVAFSFGLFKIVVVILLLAGLMSFFTKSSEKTFYSFLLMLQNVPDIFPIDGLMEYFSLTDFSHLPDFLEGLFEFFQSFFMLFAFVIKGALSALTLIFYTIRWLFI